LYHKPPKVCFRCKQEGHLSRDCQAGDQRQCFLCQQRGHLASRCPQKQPKYPQKQPKYPQKQSKTCGFCGAAAHKPCPLKMRYMAPKDGRDWVGFNS
jgi:hypothetical protein